MAASRFRSLSEENVMNNEAIIEFGFRRICGRILQISERVIHFGLNLYIIYLLANVDLFCR